MESARQIQDDVHGLNLPTFHGLCGHCKDQPHDDLYVGSGCLYPGMINWHLLRSDLWYLPGSFHPSVLYHGRMGPAKKVVPCVFTLLPDYEGENYMKLYMTIKSQVTFQEDCLALWLQILRKVLLYSGESVSWCQIKGCPFHQIHAIRGNNQVKSLFTLLNDNKGALISAASQDHEDLWHTHHGLCGCQQWDRELHRVCWVGRRVHCLLLEDMDHRLLNTKGWADSPCLTFLPGTSARESAWFPRTTVKEFVAIC